MRIVYPAGARNNFYDRNGATKGAGYSAAALASHATTQRWSYTVPGTKKCAIGGATLTLRGVTAGGPAGTAICGCRLTPSGGAATVVAQLVAFFNAPLQGMSASALEGLQLMSNDQLEGITGDTSTGASGDYAVSFAGLEFDA